MQKEGRKAGNLELVGGWLCLDFVNTVSTRIEALQHEYLTCYEDLVAWGQHVLILTDDEVQSLLLAAARQPDLALAVLERTITLRETIYRILLALVDGRESEGQDLAAMNAALHTALARLEVSPSAQGFEWTWVLDRDDMDRILWPVVYSAAELLTSGDLARVRQCAREGCDWLFVDSSKNQSRRWCSMGLCGSRVKARRYYRRKNRGNKKTSEVV